jgi:hypothetical protein
MVRKILVYAFVVFFAGLFLACSSSDGDEVKKPKEEPLNLVELDYEWTQTLGNVPFMWEAKDGFFQSYNHSYGFDRHPQPKEGIAEDSIVYASVLNNAFGEVKVKINQEADSSSKPFDYFICKPEHPHASLSTKFDNSKDEHLYTFTASIDTDGSVKKIALCKYSDVGIQKVQELHIIPYNWKDDYNFYVYILGDSNRTYGERHQLLRLKEFWELFNHVFSQVVVKHGDLFGKFVSAGTVKIKDGPNSPERSVDRDYVLTRARGNYENDCVVGDIGEVLKDIEVRDKDPSSTRRNIIHVSYPTKRFWPLKTEGNRIDICGIPYSDEDPKKISNLELEPILKPNCPATIKASVSWDNNMNVWKLKYKDGRPDEIATEDNVKSDCSVFAETVLSDRYVGEMHTNADGVAFTFGIYAVVALLPWLNNLTAEVSIHELGHTMGLTDVSETGLSRFYGDSEEDNLMHEYTSRGYKLRKRGIIPKDTIDEARKGRKEYQWDCLHKNNFEFCVEPRSDPYYNYNEQ